VIYVVEEFRVIYCKFCKRKPTAKKTYPKICKKCAVREVSNSMIDNINMKIHTYQ
tara:strand:- start:11095 stop:11259 length:165 start_codon:yes stop_codon:yes gene_type:complete